MKYIEKEPEASSEKDPHCARHAIFATEMSHEQVT